MLIFSNTRHFEKSTTCPLWGPIRARRPCSLRVTMPLIYAFVARGPTVLAEHTSHSGNFATIAAEVRASLEVSLGVKVFSFAHLVPERRSGSVATCLGFRV